MRTTTGIIVSIAIFAACRANARDLDLNVAAVGAEAGVVGDELYYVNLKCRDFVSTKQPKAAAQFACRLEIVSVNNCYFSGGDKLGEFDRKVQWPKVEQANTTGSLVVVTDRPKELVVKWLDPTPFAPAESVFRFDYDETGVFNFSGTTTKNSDILKKMVSMDWRPVSITGHTAIPARCEFYAPSIFPRAEP